MKKILFLFVLAMTCEKVPGGLTLPNIWRCENDEVICYTRHLENAGIYCKFKHKGL